MVTSYKSQISVGEAATSHEMQRKPPRRLSLTCEGTQAESVPNSECGEAAMEGQPIKQRTEEAPTTIPQELNSLETNADDIRHVADYRPYFS